MVILPRRFFEILADDFYYFVLKKGCFSVSRHIYVNPKRLIMEKRPWNVIKDEITTYPNYLYKYCQRCFKVTKTEGTNWKYRYCFKCSKEVLKELRKSPHYHAGSYSEGTGGINIKLVKRDYDSSSKKWLKDKCEICGYKDILEVHRIKPSCEGGRYIKNNVITLCPNCHSLITKNKKKLVIKKVNNKKLKLYNCKVYKLKDIVKIT